MGFHSIDEYDASAQDTLDLGTYFTYFDEWSGEEREGCYHPASARFAALNVDGEIVTHFSCREGYVRGLSHSNYDG